MSNEEFEEMFGNTSFGTMIIIRDWVNEHYVSKNKIRDLIKELEEKEKNCNFTGLITECEIKIETLKELLEEE